MKKIIPLFLFFSILSTPALTYAKFLIVDIEPQCHINGQTCRTTGCLISDTSSWRVPVAYDGECQSILELSQKTKQVIFDVIDNFFEEQNMYRTDFNTKSLGPEGRDFVNTKLFPRIKEEIDEQLKSLETNYQKIAIYNYLASTIGYDYQIGMSER